MATDDKQFPVWKPTIATLDRIHKIDRKVAYKALRNSCGSFIARPDVRKFVLENFNHRCVYCGSADNLQIDHIISVYRAHIGDISIYDVNKLNNLQVLCNLCNAAKMP